MSDEETRTCKLCGEEQPAMRMWLMDPPAAQTGVLIPHFHVCGKCVRNKFKRLIEVSFEAV